MFRIAPRLYSNSIISRSFSINASQLFEKSCYSKFDYKIHKDSSVQEAVLKFSAFDVGCLAVINNENQLFGLFSEGDFIKKVASTMRDPTKIPISEVCTLSPNILISKPDDSLECCMSKMHFRNIRHLVIVDNNNLQGLISIKDLWRETILRDKEMISRLTNFYIGKGAFFGSE